MTSLPPSAPRACRWWPRHEALPAGVEDEAAFDAVLDAACHRLTLVEAVTAVVTETSGGPVHQCHAAANIKGQSLAHDVLVFAVEDRAIVHQIHTDDALAWSPEHAPSWYLLSARRELLETTLRLMRASSGSPEQVLRIPHYSLIHAKSQAAGALSMWWLDRMSEGHTAESARLLLGMSMDPLMWVELVWPDEIHETDDNAASPCTPRFWWCRTTVHHPIPHPSHEPAATDMPTGATP